MMDSTVGVEELATGGSCEFGSGCRQRGAVFGLCRKAVGGAGPPHRDREGPFRAYCAGLLGTEGRKSVEPLAAATAPSRVSGQHQSLLHFVGQSERCDAAVLAAVRAYVLPTLERRGPIEAWISTTRASPSRAGIRSGWRGNIAVSLASGPTARPR